MYIYIYIHIHVFGMIRLLLSSLYHTVWLSPGHRGVVIVIVLIVLVQVRLVTRMILPNNDYYYYAPGHRGVLLVPRPGGGVQGSAGPDARVVFIIIIIIIIIISINYVHIHVYMYSCTCTTFSQLFAL